MIDALVIEPGGEVYDVKINDWTDYKTLVGGFFECPPMNTNQLSVFCNDEGKIIGLLPNPLGTAVWHAFFDTTDMIHGTVVVTGGVDEGGETQTLAKEDRDKLVAVLQNIARALPGLL